MGLVLTDDEKMLRESAEGFFKSNAPVSQLRALRDSNDELGYKPDLWQKMAEMGFAGVLVPEACGGVDMGYMAAGLIAEQLGANLTASPFMSTAVLSAVALRHGGSGSDERRAELLAKIATGDVVLALAHHETRHPTPPGKLTTRLENGRLSGTKVMVLDGHVAGQLIVSARHNGAVCLVLVDPKGDGVEIERTIMIDSHNAARVTLHDVAVEDPQIIGDASALNAALDAGMAVTAAIQLGAAQATFDQTVAYLKERKQFGRIIGEFQALQHRAAHWYCELEVARSAVLAALTALDEDLPSASDQIRKAKTKLDGVSTLAANEGVQMHGGIGMTDEVDVGLYMKQLKAL